jgi:hypothetical protein
VTPGRTHATRPRMHLETLAELMPREACEIIMDNINGGENLIQKTELQLGEGGFDETRI